MTRSALRWFARTETEGSADAMKTRIAEVDSAQVIWISFTDKACQVPRSLIWNTMRTDELEGKNTHE